VVAVGGLHVDLHLALAIFSDVVRFMSDMNIDSEVNNAPDEEDNQ
jgi:predicted double-glycine peptidase